MSSVDPEQLVGKGNFALGSSWVGLNGVGLDPERADEIREEAPDSPTILDVE